MGSEMCIRDSTWNVLRATVEINATNNSGKESFLGAPNNIEIATRIAIVLPAIRSGSAMSIAIWSIASNMFHPIKTAGIRPAFMILFTTI